MCIVLTFGDAKAQSLEAGVFLGLSNYQGDLQPRDFTSSESNVAYGVFAKYQLLEYVKVRASLMKGQISGSDHNSSEESGRRQRNLNFKSDILDFGIQGEFHPLPLIVDEVGFISPYIMLGINGFTFNPRTFYEGEWYDLAELGTEGQYLEGSGVSPYKTFQVAIPMGIGFDLAVSEYNSIGFEFGLRKTFTDYLDDVSGVYPNLDELKAQNSTAAALSYRIDEYYNEILTDNPEGNIRGNSKNNDLYFFAGINFTFNLAAIMNLGSGPGVYSAF